MVLNGNKDQAKCFSSVNHTTKPIHQKKKKKKKWDIGNAVMHTSYNFFVLKDSYLCF